MNENTPNTRISRRGRRKAELLRLLGERDVNGIIAWSQSVSYPLGQLSTALFEADPLIRWRAIEAIGLIAAELARDAEEKVRSCLRRLLWLMNDESGGICWYAPEAIAEILFRTPALIEEYGPILLSFLKEEPFEAGVCLGVARLMDLTDLPDDFERRIADSEVVFRRYLESPNPGLRAGALMVLTRLGGELVKETINRLVLADASIGVYDFNSGELVEVNISDMISDR